MQRISSLSPHTRSLTAALLYLACASAAFGADTYKGGVLTLPTLAIGSATYSTVVINPIALSDVVAFTVGGTPSGSEDRYDPGTARLIIPTITVGTTTYTNVIVAVPTTAAVSIGRVTTADTYDGTNLRIAQVQVGGTVYQNVVVAEALSDVVSVTGGMPTALPDTYNSLTNQLSMPAVQVGSRVYTNVVVTAGKLQSVGGVSFRNQESVVHAFTGFVGGANPSPTLVEGSDGNFYGTASQGGAYDQGVVFRITPTGTETGLYSFAGGSVDGSSPNGALIQGSDGNLYGTTLEGGAYNQGVVFTITPAGTETVLHSFTGGAADGSSPNGGLIQGSDGNFYGTTATGGLHNHGAIFKISHAGALTLLYSFGSGTLDGNAPNGALVQSSDGNFYGTTQVGGTYGEGTFFKVTAAGIETVLYSFGSGPTDGAYPYAPVRGSDGSFYIAAAVGANGGGAVIKITPAGVKSVLYSFASSTWGGSPSGALVQATDGNYYGTYLYSASPDDGSPSYSVVIKVTPAGAETLLYSFGPTGGYTDADGALIQGRDGNLYGTGFAGGTYNGGTVFKVTLAGAGTVLYSFAVGVGVGPFLAIQGSDSNFYGTTGRGGANNNGTVFKVTPAGVKTVLYSFGSGPADGQYPSGPVIQGDDGNYYGTTDGGGANENGIVFKITPAGVETVLYSFGSVPTGSSRHFLPIQGSDGNFYGTTQGDGTYGGGTFFKITPAGVETVLYSFGSGPADGQLPYGPVIQGSDGNFYGMTAVGGAYEAGTFFKITPAGVETVLRSLVEFTDAYLAGGALIQGSDGNFYTAIMMEGDNYNGAVLKITPAGVETVLYAFAGGADGSLPSGALMQGSDGNYYGTTFNGGIHNEGTIFKITPAGVETVLYSFGNGLADGQSPGGPLIQGTDGSLYGATGLGGYGSGVVFSLTTVLPNQ